MRREADDAEHKWLRDKGWSETSQTPGCYWMWLMEWGGKTLLVNQQTAARIQAIWDADEDARLHPERYED